MVKLTQAQQQFKDFMISKAKPKREFKESLKTGDILVSPMGLELTIQRDMTVPIDVQKRYLEEIDEVTIMSFGVGKIKQWKLMRDFLKRNAQLHRYFKAKA